MKKKITILISFILFINLLKAQNNLNKTKIIETFSTTYYYESKLDYNNAILTFYQFYDRNSYEMNMRLGWLNYLKGDMQTSIIYYKIALENEPSSIQAHWGLILPYTELKLWEEVRKELLKILELDPINYSANYRLALSYYYMGDYKRSENYLNIIFKLYPFDYDITSLLGYINIKKGEINEARKYFTIALKYNPSNEEIRNTLNSLH